MTEERAIEVYQDGYRMGFKRGREFIENGNKRVIRSRNSRTSMSGYTKEEKKEYQKGYAAAYVYALKYPDKPCLLDD